MVYEIKQEIEASQVAIASESGPPRRNPALDYVRAFAVLMVIAYHSVQMSPLPLPRLRILTSYGEYGVDLFFVLSGWLIGGLYWRERRANGRVALGRFWARRWMRTLPPYFVALAASWAAVSWVRREPFDWGYLVFAQNYYAHIPYFLVSWSLCVEEHFYLIAPLAAAGVASFARGRLWLVCWASIVILSPLLRAFELPPADGFGYAGTATHLRLDGLVLGFGASRLSVYAPQAMQALARRAPIFLAACIPALVVVRMSGALVTYVLWPFVVALAFTAIVVVAGSREPRSCAAGSFSRIVRAVALASYSAYLVHPLCIHVARLAAFRAGSADWIIYWLFAPSLIATASAAFYFLCEKTSVALRDIVVPASNRTILKKETVAPH